MLIFWKKFVNKKLINTAWSFAGIKFVYVGLSLLLENVKIFKVQRNFFDVAQHFLLAFYKASL